MQTLIDYYENSLRQHGLFQSLCSLTTEITSKTYPNAGVCSLECQREGGIFTLYEVHTRRVWNNQELVDRFVMLHDMPLAFWQATDCGTCAKLIQAGFDGAEEVSRQVQLIQSLTIDVLQQPASTWIDRLMGILELFPRGFYYLTLLDYSPTDGNGNFFWDVFQVERTWYALTQGRMPNETYPDPYQNRPPCFLAPSQSPTNFSYESLNRAKDSYNTHPGLALELRQQGALLLDGHHRATAAALAGKPFACLTIVSMGEFSPGMIHFNESISIPKPFRHWLSVQEEVAKKKLASEEYLRTQQDISHWREAMLDHISTAGYAWSLPPELKLQEAVKHFPLIHKLDRQGIEEQLAHFKRFLYPEHIRFSEERRDQMYYL